MNAKEVQVEFLRHAAATLAYRGGKALRDAPPSFAGLRIGPSSRTPLEILTHIGDLFEWAASIANGEERWPDPAAETAGSWEVQVGRFYEALARLDRALSGSTIACPPEKLFQGPIADALTHIGQLALLRRLVDSPVRGENYFRADIASGRIGTSQAKPIREFD